MQLTKYIREAFVRAAMQDVPKVDYSEQMRAVAQKIIFDSYPPMIQKLVKSNDPLLSWLKRNTISFGGNSYSIIVESDSYSHRAQIEARVSSDEKYKELFSKETEQRTQFRALQTKLESIAEGCKTRKQLAEALPEFEQYLPAPVDKPMRSLPVIANVVSEFVKAGWPKDKQPTKVEVKPEPPTTTKPAAKKTKKAVAKQTA